MVKPVEPAVELPNITSVFCPNCGVPKNAKLSMDRILRRRGVVFQCNACKFVCYMTRKIPKSQEDEIKLKDVVDGVRTTKTAVGLLKGL